MTEPTLVSLSDLLLAFEWLSSGEGSDNAVYVSRTTGAIHWASDSLDLEEDLPEDLDDESLYALLPDKNDLDLGSRLVFRFVDRYLPEDRETVSAYFHQRGAYGRFKSLLERRNQLQAWYDFQANAVETALREWAEQEGLQLRP